MSSDSRQTDSVETLVGEAEQKARVIELGIGADTFQPPHPSDDNPFRVLPDGIRFKGYHHDDDCPRCDTYGDEKGTVSDYLGGPAGSNLAVYICESCLVVWVASFGYSPTTEYSINHIHHPDNRIQ